MKAVAATLTTLAALVVAVSAAAASPGKGWTPPQVAKMLTTATSRIYNVEAAASMSATVRVPSTATCSGSGRRIRGVYPLFTCRLAWVSANGVSGGSPTLYFVRAWGIGTACVTTVSQGACPPKPPAKTLRNDPRACGPDYAACVRDAADAAVSAPSGGAAVCVAGTAWTVYSCTWPGGTATVTFKTSRGAWTAVTG